MLFFALFERAKIQIISIAPQKMSFFTKKSYFFMIRLFIWGGRSNFAAVIIA